MYVTRGLRAIGFGLMATLMMSGAALAQQGVPAETPPASFTGDQYTDSRGCIFVRAGIGGNTSWVPRVGRDRQQLCGYSPSLATPTTRTAEAPAPRPQTADNDVVVIGAATATTTALGGAAGTPRPAPPAPQTRTTAAAPAASAAPRATAPARTVVRTVRTQPAVRTAPAAPRVVTQPAPLSAAACANLPEQMRAYFTGPNPRCGPQAVHPGDVARGLDRTSSAVAVTVPEGYRLAWQDDRLNPMRGAGTAVGEAQMRQIWSDDIPMALVAPTGRVVVTEPTASTRSAPVQTRPTQQASEPTPARAQIRIPSGHRHVLAATYSSRADADRAYARLAAGGLPARLGQIDRASGMVYAVVAGPFGSAQAVADGLQSTRAMGFSGAVTRR